MKESESSPALFSLDQHPRGRGFQHPETIQEEDSKPTERTSLLQERIPHTSHRYGTRSGLPLALRGRSKSDLSGLQNLRRLFQTIPFEAIHGLQSRLRVESGEGWRKMIGRTQYSGPSSGVSSATGDTTSDSETSVDEESGDRTQPGSKADSSDPVLSAHRHRRGRKATLQKRIMRFFRRADRQESHADLRRKSFKKKAKRRATSQLAALQGSYTWTLISNVVLIIISAFQFGYHTGVINVPAGIIRDSVGIDETDWAVIVSIFTIGGLFGALTGGKIADKLGRRMFILLNALLFTAACLLQAFSTSYFMLAIGRFIVGIASGHATVVVPMYLGELATPNMRGTLGTLNQFAIVIGIFVAQILGKPLGTESSWWYLFLGAVIPSALQILLGPVLLQESPRWLISHCRIEESKAALVWLRCSIHIESLYDLIRQYPSASSDLSIPTFEKNILTPIPDRPPEIVASVHTHRPKFNNRHERSGASNLHRSLRDGDSTDSEKHVSHVPSSRQSDSDGSESDVRPQNFTSDTVFHASGSTEDIDIPPPLIRVHEIERMVPNSDENITLHVEEDVPEEVVQQFGEYRRILFELDNIQGACPTYSTGKTHIKFSDETPAGVRDLITDKSIRLALVIGLGLQFAQQLSGINVVFYYSSDFFKNAGVTNDWLGTVLIGAVNVAATGGFSLLCFAIPLMDILGRRSLLLWSSAGMFFSVVVLTLVVQIDPSGTGWSNPLHFSNQLLSTLKIISMMAFVIFFELGLGPIPWLIGAEIFTSRTRGSAMSTASAFNWLCNFAVSMAFPIIQLQLGTYSFVPFGILLMIEFVFIRWFVIETKGKSLDAIQIDLAKLQQQKLPCCSF